MNILPDGYFGGGEEEVFYFFFNFSASLVHLHPPYNMLWSYDHKFEADMSLELAQKLLRVVM